MLEVIAIFLIGFGVVSMFTSYTATGFIYALLIVSIFITLVGVIKGKRDNQFSDKHVNRQG